MRVLHLNTNELEGGAGRAANRLHQGMLSAGIDSQMLVQVRSTAGPRVHGSSTKIGRGIASLRPSLDQAPLYLWGRSALSGFAVQWFPDGLLGQVGHLKPDVVNLHWINKGFLRIETLRRMRLPLVWTLHDMWPMTGGCFHSGECERYTARCGACPQLHSRRQGDLSRWIWQRKQRAWSNIDLTIVCPSAWMAQRAAASSLFGECRIEIIPNGLDVHRYRPVERPLARQWLGLPPDKKLILFSAVRGPINPYKGFHYLPAILSELVASGWQDRVNLVLLGDVQPQDVESVPVPVHRLGHLQDDISLALAYGAADVFLAPSQIDNLPNTVMEALACGTPPVAFRAGGIPEMIEHEANGYLAGPGDIGSLAAGIDWVLQDESRQQRLAEQARLKALRDYDQEAQARRYAGLFEELLAKKSRQANG